MAPRDEPIGLQEEVYADVTGSEFFTDSIPELAALDPRYAGITTVQQLSARNIDRLRAFADQHIDGSEASRFLAAFAGVNFYWKHSTGSPLAYDSIGAYDQLISGLKLKGDDHAQVKARLQGDFQARVDDRVAAGLNTGDDELLYRQDGGFIYFRVEPDDRPVPSTRFGGMQFILDPAIVTRLPARGWVTLRDVVFPYSAKDFEKDKNLIAEPPGRDASAAPSQRITLYHRPNQRAVLDMRTDDDTRLSQDQIDAINDTQLAKRSGYELSRMVQHVFFGGREGHSARTEHVLESAFTGQFDIPQGIAYSAMRAFWELPGLWRIALEACTDKRRFEAFIAEWLHRFFHIEGKYPWQLNLPPGPPGSLERPGLRIHIAKKAMDPLVTHYADTFAKGFAEVWH